MQKSLPLRSCIVCRKKADKSNFIKLVKNSKGEISVESDVKFEGRGAYICSELDCISKAKKTKAISRAFKMQVDDSIYQRLEDEFKRRQN